MKNQWLKTDYPEKHSCQHHIILLQLYFFPFLNPFTSFYIPAASVWSNWFFAHLLNIFYISLSFFFFLPPCGYLCGFFLLYVKKRCIKSNPLNPNLLVLSLSASPTEGFEPTFVSVCIISLCVKLSGRGRSILLRSDKLQTALFVQSQSTYWLWVPFFEKGVGRLLQGREIP